MKQTPQIRLVFTLTKRDGTDFERDAVTRGLGISPTMSCAPTPGKGKVQHCGKEIREPDEQVLPGFTVLPAEAPPYPTLRHAYWSAELPKMDCRSWSSQTAASHFGRPWEQQSASTFILINKTPRTVRKPNSAGGLICGDVPRYTITVSSILKRVCP